MTKTTGRKLIRSPFPLDQSLKMAAVLLRETRSSLNPKKQILADIDTQRQPALTAKRLHEKMSALAEADTWKNPTVKTDPLPHQEHLLPQVLPHYPPVQHSSAPPSAPPLVPQTSGVPQKKKRAPLSTHKKIQLILLATLVLLPSLLILLELISAFVVYKHAEDGIAHLQAVENIFRGNSSAGFANYFNVQKLEQAQTEINAARSDFDALSNKLDNDGAIALAANLWPTQIRTARTLGHIADTGMEIAQQLLQTMRDIAPAVAPTFQKAANASNAENAPLKPFLTPASYQRVNMTLMSIIPLVHDMANEARGLSLSSLPLSSSQRATLTSVLPLLPALDTALPQIYQAKDALGWFLGVDRQRSYLVEPMDSAELRATGGFTGQFGELTLNGAHMGPLRLSNIGKYEEDHTAEGSPPDSTIYPKVIGQTAPSPYANWWPIANFGLRDANLSADFPTSAQFAMERYHYEFGNSVDGVILFTPALIEHVLEVTGPLKIANYNQTITAQNLQDLLHYYQLNNTAIRQEEIIEHVSDTQIARKLFTQRVTQTLMSNVTHLPSNKMLSLANAMFQSMKSKDLQVYVTNPQLEALIAKYGSTAALDRSTSHDGIFIVQSNLSASKASQYVKTTLQDTILLNEAGGATHNLQITLDYQQKGDVYGLDTYRDYVRIYVPVNSQLLTGKGFDQYDEPYCGDDTSGYRLCQPDVYGDGSLVCTPPISIGFATSYLNDPYTGKDHPLDVTGPPQNQQSDEPGRAMFGGWIVIPKNCTMKVTLSWYVPPMSKQPYQLLFQAQASVYASLDLTMHAPAKTCARNQDLRVARSMNGTDLSFTVKRQGTKCALVS